MTARTDLTVREEHAIVALSGSPQEVINKAIEMATPLAMVVRKADLVVKVGDKEYVRVEGWNVLGAMCGVLPQVEWSRKIGGPEFPNPGPIVYEARVNLVNGAGRIISTAESMASGGECSQADAKRKCPLCGKETLMFFREAKYGPYKGQKAYWCAPAKDGGEDGGCNKNFPGNDERIVSQIVGKIPVPAPWTHDEYSIRSMCITRTIGKAYRSTLSWVMKLAGFEPTPLEDMPGMAVESEAVVVADEKPSAAVPPAVAPAPKVEAATMGPVGPGAAEVARETPVSAASTKGYVRNYAAEFKATMEAFYGLAFKGPGSGERLTRCVNTMAGQFGLGVAVESYSKVTPSQWVVLAETAVRYVESKSAGSVTDVAGRDPAPQSKRWQDNTSADADRELDLAAAAAANAGTDEEVAAADKRLADAKRIAKSQGQAAVFASIPGLIGACERAAKKFSKTRPDKTYLQQVGAVTYFVDADIMDACGLPSAVGMDLDGMTPEQRTVVRRAVEAEVEAM